MGRCATPPSVDHGDLHRPQVKRDRVTKLVVLPLYPQFSISTSGSSLRLLERLFKEDPALRGLKHTVIPSWYERPGYVRAMADLIQQVWLLCFFGVCVNHVS